MSSDWGGSRVNTAHLNVVLVVYSTRSTTTDLESDMRYIQQGLDKQKKEKPLRDIPKQGKYTVKDLQREGIRKGSWEKEDEQRN